MQLKELHLVNMGLELLPAAIGALHGLRDLCLGRNLLGLRYDALPDELTQVGAVCVLCVCVLCTMTVHAAACRVSAAGSGSAPLLHLEGLTTAAEGSWWSLLLDIFPNLPTLTHPAPTQPSSIFNYPSSAAVDRPAAA